MGRLFFFIREGLRALRRSAAPGLASIVTVCITVLLAGVLIPVLQATNGKNNDVRDQVGLRVFVSDVSSTARRCRAEASASRRRRTRSTPSERSSRRFPT